MLDIDQFRSRGKQLFDHCRERWRRKLEKELPKGVRLTLRHDEVLPFTRNELIAWLWKQFGLQAHPCPYCSAPIDILSMQLDHKTPLRRGGGPELDNLQCICKRCNQVKGELTHEEFSALLVFMETSGGFFRSRLEGALINGWQGGMMKFFPRGKKQPREVAQPTLNLSELGEF
jgi:HNH endonuclease